MIKLSILLPVYNAEAFIRESIQSLLNQSFSDYELLIVDDCSTDKSYQEILKFSDKRISVFKNDTNKGIVYSLNYLLSIAKGQFIALMHADDIAIRDRMLEQVNFLNQNTDIDLVGTDAHLIDRAGTLIGKTLHNASDHDTLSATLYFNNCFVHPSICIRRTLVEQGLFLYKENYLAVEDYKLWTDIVANGARVSNINKPLMQYRIHDEQTFQKFSAEVANNGWRARVEYFLNTTPSPNQVPFEILFAFCSNSLDDSAAYFDCLNAYDRLISKSRSMAFNSCIASFLKQHLHTNFRARKYLDKWYLLSNAQQFEPLTFKERLKFFLLG